MSSFWQKIKKPITILAPMEDVTDTVFRQIVAECGRPDVFFTEFTSTDGLCSLGEPKVVGRLRYSQSEHPLVAQIWGNKPDNFYEVAKKVLKMGFDGIDINMGCPAKNVTKIGACSALIKNPQLALEIIKATKKGAESLPISVKTRIGYHQIETESWVTSLLQSNITALTLHARTVREQSKVPAHWEEVRKAVNIRNQMGVKTLIIGNGDVSTFAEIHQKAEQYKVDGVMVGRGIFQNIWLFNPKINPEQVTLTERINLLEKHVNLFEKTWEKTKQYAILKKFFKIYLSGFYGSSEIRNKFMETNNYREVRQLIKKSRLPKADGI